MPIWLAGLFYLYGIVLGLLHKLVFISSRSCKHGDKCDFAHSHHEWRFHPAFYRTIMCKDSTSCAHKFCYYAHTDEELRCIPDGLSLWWWKDNTKLDMDRPDQNTALPQQNTTWLDIARINPDQNTSGPDQNTALPQQNTTWPDKARIEQDMATTMQNMDISDQSSARPQQDKATRIEQNMTRLEQNMARIEHNMARLEQNTFRFQQYTAWTNHNMAMSEPQQLVPMELYNLSYDLQPNMIEEQNNQPDDSNMQQDVP